MAALLRAGADTLGSALVATREVARVWLPCCGVSVLVLVLVVAQGLLVASQVCRHG
jgi:uncharacterized membrane protein